MKTQDILNVDGNTEEGYEIINKALTRVFDGDSDYKTTHMLEQKLFEYTRKYILDIRCVVTDCKNGEKGIIYRLCYQAGKSNFNLLNIYGNSIWETYAKTVICFFSLIRKGGVQKR